MATLTHEASAPVLDAVTEFDSLALVGEFVAKGLPTRGIYEGSLSEAPDGVYISPSKADISVSPLPEFEGVELLSSGLELTAGDSHHKVVFGKITVKRPDGSSELINVAIKPFDTNSEAAGREHDALLGAHQLGFDTLEPLALAKDGETTFLITRRRDEIISRDNEPWHISPSDTERYQAEVVPVLEECAENLARTHAAGVFQGDAQAKNHAKTDTGGFVLIDLESATIASSPEEHVLLFTGGEDIRDGKAYEDLTHFWYALTHPMSEGATNIFLVGETSEVCMEEYRKHFLLPYLKTLKKVTHPSRWNKFPVEELGEAAHAYAERTT